MRKLFIATAIFSSLVVAPLTVMLLDNQPPYDWEAGYIYPDPADEGAQINVCWHLTINRWCPGLITRQIIDAHGEIHNYDPVPAAQREDVKDPFCVTFKLPLGLPKGLSKYRVHASYNCNPLQYHYPLKVTTPVLPFTQN